MKNNEHFNNEDFFNGNVKTPMHKDAFALSDEQKKQKIEQHFAEIMYILGLDLNDDSLKDSPKRVAKMFVDEIFYGLKSENVPLARTFENSYGYGDKGQMLIEKDITLYSTCEHHFLPIVGKAHIAYISKGRIIGLSKINRIVDYFAKRPQVQERLTKQIVEHLQKVLQTPDVACIIEAKHLCVNSRGIKDSSSSTTTAEFAGAFADKDIKYEFLKLLK